MFSALKSKLSSTPSPTANDKSTDHGNHGINSMNAALQRKFARGVHYNLKLLLRGDRNTGKSCLFKRLQGGSFVESYTPTDEINVTSIQWNYKATDDIVKVEVWDVVDKGKKRAQLSGLKIQDTKIPNIEQPALDAEFVDVFKGAHGVIIMFDVTKAWTFDYVKREAPKVPKQIPLLILANFIDQAHHRCVSRAQVIGYIEDELDRGDNAAGAKYAESSMRNGFGLKFLHKFLNLPFLTLQRESLVKQLETNAREMQATVDELDLFLDSDDANYQVYSSGVTKKRRAQAESLAPAPTIDVVVGQPSNVLKDSQIPVQGDLPKLPKEPEVEIEPVIQPKQKSPNKKVDDVEDFVPEDQGIDNFLEIEDNIKELNINEEESDEDTPGLDNPMVASFAEDVDIEDYDAVVPDLELDQESQNSPKLTTTTKTKLKTKLSNSSSKSEDLHFDIPEHLKPKEFVVEEDESEEKKKSKKSKKTKKKRRKSSDKERDDLEEFLNGIPPVQPQEQGSYEEL